MRLGATSMIYPGSLVENVELLAPYVDDIELIFYWTEDDLTNYPTPRELERLRELAERWRLTYTVHLPSYLRPTPWDERRWERDRVRNLRLVELVNPLKPWSYLMHWEPALAGREPAPDFAAWLEWQLRLVESLVEEGGVAPRDLAIENLSYDYRLIEAPIEARGLGVCLDLGHLWQTEWGAEEILEWALGRARVYHLHGVLSKGRDHVALQAANLPALERWQRLLSARYQGEDDFLLTWELFSQSDLRASWELLAAWQPAWRQEIEPRLAKWRSAPRE